ncbi:J domain-containing protein [Acidocella sp.]|uniref:J domain-containing protein n=1 Tax=Acidocella sp. TaxID=50710 RepID=UPI00262603D6|nr:DnaJ domain-containing protein [Acidocella sp.]
MMSTSRKTRAFAPDPASPGLPCDTPGCEQAGEFRAPKSRTTLRDFHWFCLEHVRAYNAAWDYYKGMAPEEIEGEIRADSSWQRPTWPLGQQGRQAHFDEAAAAELHAFAFGTRPKSPPKQQAPAELHDALGIFGMAWPVTFAAVKAKYKELAKRHHPDANNGSKQSEETLKRINLAYATLRAKLAMPPPQPAAD